MVNDLKYIPVPEIIQKENILLLNNGKLILKKNKKTKRQL